MNIVILESPYAGNIAENERYARAAMRDCLLRGEAPYASHLLYTQLGVLRDDVPSERELGIQAGFGFRQFASKTVVYTDQGFSDGMSAGIMHAHDIGQPVEFRELPGWEEK